MYINDSKITFIPAADIDQAILCISSPASQILTQTNPNTQIYTHLHVSTHTQSESRHTQSHSSTHTHTPIKKTANSNDLR